MKPFIPEMLVVLERQRELILAEPIKTQLLTMSRATIDRCLKSARFEPRKGLSTTKPGTLAQKRPFQSEFLHPGRRNTQALWKWIWSPTVVKPLKHPI
jgi:hypothetical protein